MKNIIKIMNAALGLLNKAKHQVKDYSVGFTLVELLVVVGVLGILAAAAIATLDPIAQFQKANDARRKSDLSQISKALETYYQDNGRYPSYDSSSYEIVGASWGTAWTPYMSLLPKDPVSDKSYVYYAPNVCPGNNAPSGQCYFLYASLDREGKDPEACNEGEVCGNVPEGATCGTGICNYGITSPNESP